MTSKLKSLFKRLPGIAPIVRQRDELLAEISKIKKRHAFEDGHFYSPIPGDLEITECHQRNAGKDPFSIPGIRLDRDAQLGWCERIAEFYDELPFPDQAGPETRYYYDNQTFCATDAIFLYGMLRVVKPKRIVEIGSGFSSAVVLDTNERFMDPQLTMTFIEPYPDRLNRLIGKSDPQGCEIIAKRVQDVDEAPWKQLEKDDILFVDSSHVSKCGSDVNQIIFEILPSLSPGVLVHVHDVFPHFEYPETWTRQGRFWNEDYLLRAFLQFNSEFDVVLWAPLMVETNRDYFESKMPLCLKNSGGSFWFRRNGAG